MGQAPFEDRGTVRRHEAARADRQGAQSRADHPVPRRTDRGRRRRAAQGHVAGGARPARCRRHHHPHHPLYRGSRGHGRPRRRHQQGRDDPGRREGRADAKARQEASRPACHRPARRRPPRPFRLQSHDRRRRPRAGLRLRHAGRAHRRRHAARRIEPGWRAHSRSSHGSVLARADLRRISSTNRGARHEPARRCSRSTRPR